MSGGFFRGTTLDQDSRFADKNKKLQAELSFPPEYDYPIEFANIKMDVIKPWITQRITELLGFEDEVVTSLIFNLLETKPNPRELQINLTGFLDRNAKKFVLELWKMLISASQNVAGIPTIMLEKKKKELLQKKEEHERLEKEVKKKREELEKGQFIEQKKGPSSNPSISSAVAAAREMAAKAAAAAGRIARPSSPRRSKSPRRKSRSRSRSSSRGKKSRKSSRWDKSSKSKSPKRKRSKSSSPPPKRSEKSGRSNKDKDKDKEKKEKRKEKQDKEKENGSRESPRHRDHDPAGGEQEKGDDRQKAPEAELRQKALQSVKKSGN